MNNTAILRVVAAHLALPTILMAGELSISVSTDKGAYLFGDPIALTMTVTNNTDHSAVLSTLPFYMVGGMLHIQSPAGSSVRAQRSYGRTRRDVRPRTITLQPGGVHATTYNLRDHYVEYRAGPGGSPHSLDMPGTYELSAKYHIAYAHNWPDVYEGIFLGPIESNTITFTVKPLGGELLAQALQQLEGGDVEAKIAALNRLRRGKRIGKVPDIMQYLDSKQPGELRVAVARAISKSPDPELWRTYAAYLHDPGVASLMAYSLEQIGTKEAADALYAVTDPEKFPMTYAAAFGALVRMGDPRSKEVAARLQNAALDEWTRKFARDHLASQSN